MKKITIYTSKRGKKPFSAWIQSIKDIVTRAKIKNRLNRLELGHYGDYKRINNKINELRLDYGPGYRVYFVILDDINILILNGGSKRSQHRDICLAISYWRDYWERKDD